MARGGPRPNSGGARPGAGRKTKSTLERQIANRDVVLKAIDKDALISAVKSMVAEAQSGNTDAFRVIAPYLLGAPTQQIEVSGPAGGPFTVRVIYDDPDPAAAEAT